MDKNEVVKIFWTGGLDSTFRVLKLIVVLKKNVRPYYIFDPNRKSRFAEPKAINSIKSAVLSRFPYTKDLLDDLVVVNLNDIGIDKNRLETYIQIAKRFNIGVQYSWLACYCAENEIENMEMCMHRPGDNHDYLVDRVDLVNEVTDPYYVYKYKKGEIDEQAPLYRLYKFPLLYYTKLQMFEESKKHNFFDILELSWFCHAPKLKNKPCGTCTPCVSLRSQGLKRRITTIGHARYYLIVKTGLKELLKKVRDYRN